MNLVGLNEGKIILKGDCMFMKNVQRPTDDVRTCSIHWLSAKFWNITYIKGGKFPNVHSGYTETNGIRIGTAADFILEQDNKK
jgi:hypothetical protein